MIMKKINSFKFLFCSMVWLGVQYTKAQSLQNDKVGDIYAEDIKWSAFPSFPPEARLAVLIGDPKKEGPYVVRVRLPSNVVLMPHKHPETRVYTVISGVFYIGIGEKYDPTKLKAYPPGSVFVLPANTPHFHWAKSGGYETQVSAYGPLGISYINPSDDPSGEKTK